MPDRLIMTRLLRGRAPGREFDIAFWQALGPNRIFEAAWDLVVTAAAVRGIHEDASSGEFVGDSEPQRAVLLRNCWNLRHVESKDLC